MTRIFIATGEENVILSAHRTREGAEESVFAAHVVEYGRSAGIDSFDDLVAARKRKWSPFGYNVEETELSV